MKLLILGGTEFVGRHLVEAALERGHEVTLFNRGQTNPDLFPDLEKLRGERDGNLEALKGGRWDAVMDTSGYAPRVVHASASLLAEAAAHYTFISSVSVYADMSEIGLNEESALGELEDKTVEEITDKTYGPLKALCEQVVQNAFPERSLILRPGLIVGPHDPTDRFTYWPWRVAQGGEVVAPGDPNARTQIIDARDLAEWSIRLVEAGQTGIYNAVGPDRPLTLRSALVTAKALTASDAAFTWVDRISCWGRAWNRGTNSPYGIQRRRARG